MNRVEELMPDQYGLQRNDAQSYSITEDPIPRAIKPQPVTRIRSRYVPQKNADVPPPLDRYTQTPQVLTRCRRYKTPDVAVKHADNAQPLHVLRTLLFLEAY